MAGSRFPRAAAAAAALGGLAALLLWVGAWSAEPNDWQDAAEVDGVTLAYRATTAGYREFRGSIRVCTDLLSLQAFVADAERFHQWIPFTEEAQAVPESGPGELYYLRTRTPWPLQSRDMIYRLESLPAAADGAVRIAISGAPDALPPRDGAVRMEDADGQWTLHADSEGIDVTLRMAVDPGGAPAFFANRRLAATVAGTLANLHARFPCRG